MPVNLVSVGGGTTTLSPASSASSYTITLPAATGTAMVSGNMPSFSAYQNTNQSISSGVATKVSCNTEEWDTNSNYDNTTYRFTPTVAGYYQVNGATTLSATSSSCTLWVYKNGSQWKESALTNTNSGYPMGTVNCLVYLNGSTDYIEMYVQANASQTTQGAAYITYFQAAMVRSA